MSEIRHHGSLDLFYLAGDSVTLRRFAAGSWSGPETIGSATSYQAVEAKNGDLFVLMTEQQQQPRLRRYSKASQSWGQEVSLDTAGLLAHYPLSLGSVDDDTPVLIGSAVTPVGGTVDVVALVCDGIP
jgi:hypothetical protein